MQGYLAAITYADAMIGRLLDALDASAYRDNTIIVLWGDHGWHLGEKQHWRKFALWEEATRAPLDLGRAGPDEAGRRVRAHRRFHDDLSDADRPGGIPTPKHVEGKSIRALLADPRAPGTEPAVTTYRVRQSRGAHRRLALSFAMPTATRSFTTSRADPYEWTNLAAQSQFASQKKELAARLPAKNAPDVFDATPEGKARAKRRAE